VSDNPARYVLDSFGLLAHLQGEAGGARVKVLLAEAVKHRVELWMTIINYGEAIYIIEREQGLTAAQEMIAATDRLPIAMVAADRVLAFAAAHIKAHYPISYADAFAIALARQHSAILVTGDPEFKSTEALVQIEWLPQH
jgi:predicted nucleic acid-binding protein